MNTGQRTVAGMLAVVAVMLGLNLIVRGSPSAVAQGPRPQQPTIVAGSVEAPQHHLRPASRSAAS